MAKYIYMSYGVKYDPTSELLITVGASEGLDLAMRAILDPEDEVILTDPSYVAYPSVVLLTGATPVWVPTYQASNFEVSASDIESRITEKTKAILLDIPPTRLAQ